MDKTVALIVPVYNEFELVAPFVKNLTAQGLLEVLTEVIFVDDGSQDTTWAHLESFTTTSRLFRIVRHRVNQGLGAAITTGVIAASAEEVCWVPIDQEIDLADIKRQIVRTDRQEVTLFKRVHRNLTKRDMLSDCFFFLSRLLFGCDVRRQTGLFVMRRSLFLANIPITRRAIANFEFIIRIQRTTPAIQNVNIAIHPRFSGTSKTFSVRSIIRSLRELIGLIILDPHLLKRRASHIRASS